MTAWRTLTEFLALSGLFGTIYAWAVIGNAVVM